jgi:hypothetical protein
MNPEELKETAEHAHEKGERGIGLTMAIVAVLLAMATLLSHRAHTEEGLMQGKISDRWNFYQAKHIRAYEFGAMAELATLLPNGKELALKDFKKSVEEECGIPVEKGCVSPGQKDSAILRQLASDAAGGAVRKDEKGDDAIAKPHAEGEEAHGSAEKHEKPAKEGVRKEGGHTPAEKHEKPAKESARKEGAIEIQKSAQEMEEEQKLVQRRADYYDGSELFLEISIVLCSVALLSENKRYWMFSFVSTIIGVAVALWGLLLH